MLTFYSLLLVSMALQAALAVQFIWRHKSMVLVVAAGAALAEVVAVIGILKAGLTPSSAVVGLVGIYMLVNLCRVFAGKLGGDRAPHSVGLTALWLAAAQSVAGLWLAGSWAGRLPDVDSWVWLAVIVFGQAAIAAGVYASSRRQLYRSLPRRPASEVEVLSDSALPTITVAVPVRNEGAQLEACLTSILSSNYPKLEILAFDDNSSDRTPEIIRSFAHAGVRFLRSGQPQSGWLDKNRAYAELAAQANGRYIFFCGADIRLSVTSLRQLAAITVNRRKSMVAVMPQNKLVGHSPMLQAMRYYWELALPRRLFKRPPVLSSCWLVERSALTKVGGFAAFKQSMSPEAHLAYALSKRNDGYSFIRSNSSLGIYSEKAVTEQQRTAIFRRYPQMHRRPEMVAAVSAAYVYGLVGPLVVITAGGLLMVPAWLAGVAAAALLIHGYAFGLIQHAAFPHVPAWKAALTMPAAALLDIWYLHISMLKYEFGNVSWKQRDISGHVMRAEDNK